MVRTMKPVTDPALLEQLNGSSQQMKSVNDPAILAQLNGEKEPEQGMISKGWDALKGAVKGNAEFQDAGDAMGYLEARADAGFYDQNPDRNFFNDFNKISDAGTFGNVQDQAKAIQEVFGDVAINPDAGGNPFAELNGQKYYMNKPGLDMQDVLETFGEGIAYASGGGAGSAVKGLGLGARMAATGAAETGINYGAQKLAGRDEVNKTEMAMSGLAGGLFEGLTPLVSSLWGKVNNSGVSNPEAGKVIAKKMGATNLDDTQVERLGNMVRNLDPDQVTPESILQHVELNQTPTLGTLTKNQDILDTESMLRNTGRESTRAKLRMLDDANETGLQKAMTDAQSNMANGKPSGDYYAAAQNIGDAVQSAEKVAKKGVNDAYKGVTNAYVGTQPFKDAPQRFRKALSDSDVLLAPSTTARANDVLKDIDEHVKMLGDAKGVSWQAVESQRRRINYAFKGAEEADARALSIIKNEYDAVVDDAFENALLSGSEESIKNLQNARGVASDYFKKFTSKDKGVKVINKWINEGVTPEDITESFITKSGIVGKNAPHVAKAYLDVVGRNTPEHNLLKELAIQKFTANKGRAQIRAKLTDAMTNRKTFMNEVFTPKELGFLSRTVQFIDGVTKKGTIGKSSGTAERVYRWANNAVGQDMSLNGMLNGIKKAVDLVVGGERRMLSLPTKQVVINPLSGAAAQSSANYSNQ